MNRVLNIFYLLLFLSVPLIVNGQSGIAMYHLKNTTFQGNNFNPSFIPEGKLFVGLPILSGIALDYNSRASYNDIVINENGRKIWNTAGFASLMKKRNYVSLEADVSTFYLGVRANETTAFSFFVNEKMAGRAFGSKDIITLALEGNGGFIGKEIDFSKLAIDSRYYREIGLGYWKHLPKKKLSMGVRVKYLIGIFNASSDNNFDGKATLSEDNFNMAFDFKNATFNTSGVDLFSDGSSAEIQAHMIGNANTGLGIDLGANWNITKDLSAAIAWNDIGFINWKVDPKNYTIQDTTFNYGGLILKDIEDFQQSLEDSITERFQRHETNNPYKTALNSRFYSSLSYKLNPKSTLTATIANHSVSRRLRMLYGIGYSRKFGKVFTVSGNVVKSPQRGLNVGLAYAIDLGSFQYYMATDKLLGIADATNLSAMDIRFGINFIFGRNKVSSGNPEDDNKQDEEKIYQKIPLQKPREIYDKKTFQQY